MSPVVKDFPSQICREEVGSALHEGVRCIAFQRVALPFVFEIGYVLAGSCQSVTDGTRRARRGGGVSIALVDLHWAGHPAEVVDRGNFVDESWIIAPNGIAAIRTAAAETPPVTGIRTDRRIEQTSLDAWIDGHGPGHRAAAHAVAPDADATGIGLWQRRQRADQVHDVDRQAAAKDVFAGVRPAPATKVRADGQETAAGQVGRRVVGVCTGPVLRRRDIAVVEDDHREGALALWYRHHAADEEIVAGIGDVVAGEGVGLFPIAGDLDLATGEISFAQTGDSGGQIGVGRRRRCDRGCRRRRGGWRLGRSFRYCGCCRWRECCCGLRRRGCDNGGRDRLRHCSVCPGRVAAMPATNTKATTITTRTALILADFVCSS